MENTLSQRLAAIKSRIDDACRVSRRKPESVRLIAVTKTHPAELIQELINLGVHDLGENRVQEVISKVPMLHGNFSMHMIGHLQTNKVSAVIPFVRWIQSIDRVRLIEKIEQYPINISKISALVEVNTSGEQSKSGCTPDECRMICERVVQSSALELRGLMTIGPLGGTEKEVRGAFAQLRNLSEKIKDLCQNPELSMGMSGDFGWAIEEGSTMVRIGTALMGGRA